MASADQFGTGDDEPLEELFDSPKFQRDKIGLALSGGGYKAAAYHSGAFLRLNELGLLGRISRVASVSGGSIAAGVLALHWKDLQFDGNGRAGNLRELVVERLRDFLTEVNIDIPAGLAGLLLPFRSGADGVIKSYDEHLFHGSTLQDLKTEDDQTPRFVFLATNYELNSLWRFSKPYAADYRVGMIENPRFRLAEIVAASSAFPPFFCPVELDFNGHKVAPTVGADRASGDFLKRALLADGGVYDNMGLEPIVKRYGVLLISNAGEAWNETDHPKEWIGMLRRILGMIHRQAENNRQRLLMILARSGARKVAYWPLRNTAARYPKPSEAVMDPADVARAQAEDVRLWSLGAKAFDRLANHGYVLCDSAVRSYLPEVSAPAKLPF